jgi:hypothetical protein
VHVQATTADPIMGTFQARYGGLCLVRQVNQLLELQDKAAGTQKYEAIHKWTTHVNALHNTIVSRLQ